jgi:high-affinity iron transporter
VTDPSQVEARADRIKDIADEIFPPEWKEADATADFDVISAGLDRIEGALAAGQYTRAEQARLEAYAVFELGPEQRLRGLATDLFVKVEGLFWYGSGDHAGLVQLIKGHAAPAEVQATRQALDEALRDAESAIGAGPRSTAAIVTSTAVIVFREGLEAVLILAVLMASMVGAQQRLRRPMFVGAAAAFVATALTWVLAQTLLTSLTRYGGKLEAVVSLVAIAVLLLILNWFFHRVYWTEHLSGLHARKRVILGGGIVSAQLLGLVALGFTSVYREGFETVLFLQALVLEADTGTVLLGVLVGLAATAAVGVAVFMLQRKLKVKRMLILTGVLVAWVLVVMVGTTVQVMQTVGWIPVTPIQGLRLPYWLGLWFGVFPTWEGILAQAAAAAFVVGSYVAAEGLRKRRRRAITMSAAEVA